MDGGQSSDPDLRRGVHRVKSSYLIQLMGDFGERGGERFVGEEGASGEHGDVGVSGCWGGGEADGTHHQRPGCNGARWRCSQSPRDERKGGRDDRKNKRKEMGQRPGEFMNQLEEKKYAFRMNM